MSEHEGTLPAAGEDPSAAHAAVRAPERERVRCPRCAGNCVIMGDAPCPVCGGEGMSFCEGQGIPCEHCGGAGYHERLPCSECHGEGYVWREVERVAAAPGEEAVAERSREEPPA